MHHLAICGLWNETSSPRSKLLFWRATAINAVVSGNCANILAPRRSWDVAQSAQVWSWNDSHQNCNGLVTRILLFAAYLKHHTAAILPSALASCDGVISVGYKPVCPWRQPISGWRFIIKLPVRQRLRLVRSSNSSLSIALYNLHRRGDRALPVFAAKKLGSDCHQMWRHQSVYDH